MPYFPPHSAPPAPPDSSEPAAPPPEHEPRGCLFALSQPPLMLFLAVIGALLLITAVHDLFVL
ncbi:hypothetical protein GCM10023347_17320 [Streptomyces chumphonensis]|uniref:Uncharacterized protein n=1 Tax=Streptomyces chumphonensis TaxID=1214925 RepID=A0A927EZK3_9ACTN|nr:hypothetical protein [Streptomyces chumphonensis]MBD3931642.1 hypothetical protein [Streptomyces chumphonensis]